MKKLFKPCILMAAAVGMLFTACDPKAGEVVTEPTVAIEFIGTPGVSEVTVKFTPSANASKFDYAIGTEQDRDNFENGDIIGGLTEMSNEPVTHTWKDLQGGAYYVIYAMAYDAEGAAGPVSAHGFKTASSDFLVQPYYVGDNSAAFLITNTNDYHTYRYALGTAADKEAFLNDELAGIKKQSEVFAWAENYFDLTPSTEYVFYCIGQDRSGRDTQLFEIPITTYATGSDEIPNFTYEAGPKDFYVQTYTVTPNALCKQLVLYQQVKGVADGVMFGPNNWGGKLLEMFDSWKNIDVSQVMSGVYCTTQVNGVLNAQATTTDLELENPLDIYVTAYDEMYQPVLVKKFENETPAFNPNAALPQASDFDIKVTNVTSESFEVSIDYTSDNVRAYFYDVVSGKYWNEQIKGDMAALKNNMITNYLSLGWVYNMKHISNNYVIDPNIPDFTPGAKFYIGVIAMNENGPIDGGWAEEVALSEAFFLPE